MTQIVELKLPKRQLSPEEPAQPMRLFVGQSANVLLALWT